MTPRPPWSVDAAESWPPPTTPPSRSAHTRHDRRTCVTDVPPVKNFYPSPPPERDATSPAVTNLFASRFHLPGIETASRSVPSSAITMGTGCPKTRTARKNDGNGSILTHARESRDTPMGSWVGPHRDALSCFRGRAVQPWRFRFASPCDHRLSANRLLACVFEKTLLR